MIKCTNGTTHQHATIAESRACYGVAPMQKARHEAHHPTSLPVAPAAHQPPATEKQVAFIQRLAAERGVDVPAVSSKKAASATIESLLAMPKAAPASHPDAQPAGEATEGMHKIGDEIFKVQKAVHGSGHLYAKRLVPGDGFGAKATFVYAPGVLKTLSAATKMTLEEAKAFGALYGTCCVCGRTLTNETSIEAGIGPVCAGKGMWG